MFTGDGAGVVGVNLRRGQSYLSHQTHSTSIECLHKDSQEMGFVSATDANMTHKRFTWQWKKS